MGITATNAIGANTFAQKNEKPVHFSINWFDLPKAISGNEELRKQIDVNGNGYVEFDNSHTGYDQAGELFAIADIDLGINLRKLNFNQNIKNVETYVFDAENGTKLNVSEGFNENKVLKQSTLTVGNYTVIVDFKQVPVDKNSTEYTIEPQIKCFKGYEQVKKLPTNIQEAVNQYIGAVNKDDMNYMINYL